MKTINQIILGVLLGDFITAFIHWLSDNYLDPRKIKNSFLFNIAIGFELHHFIPRTILSNTYFENIQNQLSLCLIVLVLIIIFAKKILYNNFFGIISTLLLVSFSNIIHRFSHLRYDELNGILKFLQKNNILIGNDEHKIHHCVNQHIKYGVINKYTNYIYDYLNIWKILENIIYYLFNIKPTSAGLVEDYNILYDKKLKKIMNSKIPKILNKKEFLFYKNKLINYFKNDNNT